MKKYKIKLIKFQSHIISNFIPFTHPYSITPALFLCRVRLTWFYVICSSAFVFNLTSAPFKQKALHNYKKYLGIQDFSVSIGFICEICYTRPHLWLLASCFPGI